MVRLLASLLAVLALVVAEGVQPLPTMATADSQLPPQFRVVHAIPGAAPVNVLIDGVVAVPALSFGNNPPYVPVAPGPHNVSLVLEGVPSPVPLVTSEFVFNPGVTYTLFAIGAPPAPPVLLFLPDEGYNPGLEAANTRFVHASPNVPPVDLAISNGPVLFNNIAFGQASPYVPVPAGTVDLEVRLAGTTTVVLDFPAVVLTPGREYTWAALGLSGGEPPLGFLSLSDL